MKFATYGDIGAKTCQGFTGFQGHFEQDGPAPPRTELAGGRPGPSDRRVGIRRTLGSGRPGEFGAFLFIISFLTVAEAVLGSRRYSESSA